MTPEEVAVGQKVRVEWEGYHFPRSATITELLPPNLCKVKYRDGEEGVVHVKQLSLRKQAS